MASGTSTYSAWQPSMVLPKRQPPSGFHPCRVPAPSCEHAPHWQALLQPLGVIAPNGQPALYRVFTPEDVDVGAADGGRGDAHQSVERPDGGQRFLHQFDATAFGERRCFHPCSHEALP
jgi:hypothetical protein